MAPVTMMITRRVAVAPPAAPPVIETFLVSKTNDVNSIAATKPSGVVSGDLLMMIVNIDSANAVSANAVSGWTREFRINSSATDAELAMYWRISDGTEPASTTVTFSVSADIQVWYLRISGAHASTPINVLGTATTSGSTTSHAITAATTTVDNCLAFYALSFDGADATFSNKSSSGWTEGDDQKSISGGTDVSGVWGHKDIPTTGTTGGITVTSSASDGSSRRIWAISPAV